MALFRVQLNEGDLASYLISNASFDPGQIISNVQGAPAKPSYTTVQCGANEHIDVSSSDIVYVNHSCKPNIAFDLSSSDKTLWHIRAIEPIKPGDKMTFFYPSTEWQMDQPFECECGAPLCLRTIKGAYVLSKEEVVNRGFVNPWILVAIEERDSSAR